MVAAAVIAVLVLAGLVHHLRELRFREAVAIESLAQLKGATHPLGVGQHAIAIQQRVERRLHASGRKIRPRHKKKIEAWLA